MRITAEATGEIVTLPSGQQGRVWHATTENGVGFVMIVAQVAPPAHVDLSEFERELKRLPQAEEISLNESLRRYAEAHPKPLNLRHVL